ncbi:CPBP family intramembrane metalloprotease [Paenibacillus sp. GSMTC-2017]|uniref:CPBP family intramembrane glutamic endopeptidase n=1 Tax=Paenibacillus sp. GSMTC-2017 TaxID=2794350 RepID=UPI0018D5D4E1|nr:CPBP family intramembrane glutamic endopeptidase [Paenibacillus sp. GSMTC-2017]MBH5318587.1 CPBP family intramembrane metalloprotease [Paenibacillus sp. GSMTC-2017]
MKTVGVIAKALLYLVIYAGIVLLTNRALYVWIPNKELHDWLADNPASLLVVANTIVLAVYILLLRLQKISFVDLGFKRPNSLTVSVGAGIWLGLFIAVFTQLPWMKEGYPEISGLVSFVTGGESFLVFVLGSLLLGSLLEEWLFRGMLLHVFRTRFNVYWSVLFQAILFGAVLMNVSVGIFAALGAIIYGIIRITSDSLWSSLLAHIFSTATLYVVSIYIKNWPSDMLLIVTIISGAALLAHLYAMLRGSYTKSVAVGYSPERNLN